MPPTGTRNGRALHNQPVTCVPGSAPRGARTSDGPTHHAPARPHTPPVGTARLSQHRHNRAALEPRTARPGGHSHPHAGGSGRPDPASTPAGRYRLAVQTGGRPATCSSGCGHPGQTAHRLPRPPPSGPIHGEGLPTAAPANRPDGQQRTRFRPGTGAPSRRVLSAARWWNQPTAVTVSAVLRLSQQLRRGVQHRRRGDATNAAVAVADGNADRGWGCRRRRCRRNRLAVAADVGRC